MPRPFPTRLQTSQPAAPCSAARRHRAGAVLLAGACAVIFLAGPAQSQAPPPPSPAEPPGASSPTAQSGGPATAPPSEAAPAGSADSAAGAPPASAAPAAPSPAKGDDYLVQAPAPLERDPVGTRLIDIATPYTVGEHWLELLVTHRFIQPVNQGGSAHNLWGLDSGAEVGIGFTYGLFRQVDLSVYRGEFQEDYELAAKYQLLQQGAHMPLSLAVRAGADMLGRPGVVDPHRPFAQLLLGRRLAPGWNVFVSPSFVHATPLLRDAYNVPVGVTAPLPGHWLIEAEGIPANQALHATPGASQFAWHVAFTKPLGWHLFQILIGNSRATNVDQILGGDFAGGFAERDLRLGFNLVRYFDL